MGQVIHPKLFPQCPTGEAVYSDSSYSMIGLPIAGAVYSYWVPRIWKVSLDVTQTEPPGQPPVTWEFTFGSTAEREEDLVCEPTWESKNGDQGWENAGFSLFWNNINPAPLYGFIGDGLNHRVVGGAGFTQNAEGNDDFIIMGDGTSGYPVIQETSFNAGQYSYKFPLVIGSAQYPDDPALFYQTYSNFKVEVISYWSYGGTWNIETGLPA